MSLGFFSDPGLSTPIQSLSALQSTDGTAPFVDFYIFVGMPGQNGAVLFQNSTNPGVAKLQLEIVSSGAGIPANAVQLGADELAVGASTPGAAFDLAESIYSGTDYARRAVARIDAGALAAAVYNNLSLRVANIVESMP